MKTNLLNNNYYKNNYQLNFCGNPIKFTQELKNYLASSTKNSDNAAQLTRTLTESLDEFISQQNHIGSGNYGNVYKIDDEFVLKIPKNTELKPEEVTLNENPLVQKLKTYYGDFIAKFGNITIMRNAKTSTNHMQAGVREDITDPWQKISYYRDTYLKRFNELPQEAFDDIAQDFKTLSKERKSFDTINPNNFLADGNTIKIVDDIQTPNEQFFNSLAGMMKVFLTTFDKNTGAEYDLLAIGGRRALLKKIILAGEKHELNFGSTMLEKDELNLAVRLCDYQTPWREIQSDLCEMRRRYPIIEERLKKVNEYLNDLECNDYNPFMD